MAERVFKMVMQGTTMREALASLADFLRRFRLADYFKIEQDQLGNDLVPIQKGLNAYTKLSLRSGEVGLWKEDVFQELKYYENEEGLAKILRSTVEEAAATKIQCLVRGYLKRKRYMKMAAHYEKRLLMLQYPDESAAKLAKRWMKRMYKRGFIALPMEAAAVLIQSLVRGYLVRKRARKEAAGIISRVSKAPPALLTNKRKRAPEDALSVGDHGMLNLHLSPEEKKRGVGYLGLHPTTVYEVKEVLSASEIIVQCIGQSVSYTIPSEYFNPNV